MTAKAKVYLIPTFLDEESIHVLPAYITEAVKECEVFFVENERTARRYLKKLWKEMVIDQYEWFSIHKAEEEVRLAFQEKLKEGRTIGILSEAGCPGIADPGQILVAAAQQANVSPIPLVGPSSILLALMASGLNGQEFYFTGYLPVDQQQRTKRIRELEQDSQRKNCTQIFIETPYRNNQLLESLLKTCLAYTKLCIAADITGRGESIRTKTIAEWKKQIPDLNKRPVIFLMLASSYRAE
jgi:16S rRNA (cytidine1402-2'-O)-methyltransferase